MSKVKAEFSIDLPQFLPRARACSDQVENFSGELFVHARHVTDTRTPQYSTHSKSIELSLVGVGQ